MSASHPGAGHSSADFAAVPARLQARMPTSELQLIHRDVLNSGVVADRAFSDLRRHRVRTVDLPTVALSMTVGGLDPGQATRRHRHSYETLIYVLEGEGCSTIEDLELHWRAGDAFYVPPWAWHSHRNGSATTPALYLACENAPLLQNLGAAQREEA